jgi:hypothetical protein
VINIPRKKGAGKKGAGSRKQAKGRKKTGAKSGRGKKTAAKKKEEEVKKTELPMDLSMLTGDCLLTDVMKVSWEEYREAPQDVVNNLLNPETITHLIRAALEGYAVMREIKPNEPLPDTTVMRIHRAERELLLAVKAAIDMRLKDLDIKIETEEKLCKPIDKAPAEKLLKEIKVKD